MYSTCHVQQHLCSTYYGTERAYPVPRIQTLSTHCEAQVCNVMHVNLKENNADYLYTYKLIEIWRCSCKYLSHASSIVYYFPFLCVNLNVVPSQTQILQLQKWRVSANFTCPIPDIVEDSQMLHVVNIALFTCLFPSKSFVAIVVDKSNSFPCQFFCAACFKSCFIQKTLYFYLHNYQTFQFFSINISK